MFEMVDPSTQPPAENVNDATNASNEDQALQDELLLEDVLIEDISIDGMCGVY
jgi:mycofactocin precursor